MPGTFHRILRPPHGTQRQPADQRFVRGIRNLSKQLLKFFRMNIVTHPAAVDGQPKVCNKRGQLFNAFCIRRLV